MAWDQLISLVEGLPNVAVRRKSQQITFTVNNKVFAYTQKNGVVLKLPASSIKVMVDSGMATPLVMGKRKMTEWVIVQEEDVQAYQEYFKAAHRFVGG